MRSRDIPPDFAAHATEPTPHLRQIYRVCNRTIARWRRELGIRVPCGAPKGNSNAVNNASRTPKPTYGIDGPEQVAACLNCKRPRCPGSCWMVK